MKMFSNELSYLQSCNAMADRIHIRNMLSGIFNIAVRIRPLICYVVLLGFSQSGHFYCGFALLSGDYITSMVLSYSFSSTAELPPRPLLERLARELRRRLVFSVHSLFF